MQALVIILLILNEKIYNIPMMCNVYHCDRGKGIKGLMCW